MLGVLLMAWRFPGLARYHARSVQANAGAEGDAAAERGAAAEGEAAAGSAASPP